MIETLLDELDAGRELDESMVDALVDALDPEEGDEWPELETVIRVAEHPALADDLRRHELPAELEAAIAEALDAVLPMLGIKPYGPTYKLADIARRELRRERKKRDAVVQKLDSMGESAEEREEAEKIVGRYVDTEPAPIFRNELQTLHPELMEAAQEGFDELQLLRDALDEADRLREGLDDPTSADPQFIRQAVSEIEGRRDIDDRQIGAALESDEPVVARLAAAITLIRDDAQLASRAAHAVDRGPVAAPTLSVVTGLVAPRVARMVFSQFVAEATWQNPELPEAELTEAKIRSILSARSVLPHVGSPMEKLPVDQLPDSVPAELVDLPDRIDELWAFWHAVATDAPVEGD